ncbi:MAG: GNAT family N-acetyltransferase [Methylovulum sp.]|nr:GNAT family N-acetyltransferase [Methylovulum sp.]
MKLNIYKASLGDVAIIWELIALSAQTLQAQYYTHSEIEAALELVKGIEELIAAGSFLIVSYEEVIIACGGWTIDSANPRQAELRGFFVHPEFARKGVATQLLHSCTDECLRSGVETLYLTATLSGEPFYQKQGFSEQSRYQQLLSNGESFTLVTMENTSLR